MPAVPTFPVLPDALLALLLGAACAAWVMGAMAFLDWWERVRPQITPRQSRCLSFAALTLAFTTLAWLARRPFS